MSEQQEPNPADSGIGTKSKKKAKASGVGRRPAYHTRFQKLFDKKPKKVAIFTHPFPDPDAVGSAMAVQWLVEKHFDVEGDIFCEGKVAHPQNRAMVNLLEPSLKDASEYNDDEYDLRILVDTIPGHAGLGGRKVKFDVVIDHHKDEPSSDFEGLFINIKAGSACGTVFHLIEKYGLKFDDSENDAKIATAIMVGVMTDTENLMSDDATGDYEVEAFSKCFPYRDSAALKRIINYEVPKLWTTATAQAVKSAVVEDGIGVVGLGLVHESDRDLVAHVASEMLKWQDIHTAVAFAIVNGYRIEGSVRSSNASVTVPSLCKSLGSQFGEGGGKLGKGAYRIELAGAGIDDEDDEQTKATESDFFNQKETKRVFRIIKNQ